MKSEIIETCENKTNHSQSKTETSKNIDLNTQPETIKKKFIDDKHYNNLLNLCNEIYETTNVSPSISKVVNIILEQTNLETIKQQLIEKLR